MFKSKLSSGKIKAMNICPFLTICSKRTGTCPSNNYLMLHDFFCNIAKDFDTIIKKNMEDVMKNKLKMKTAEDYMEIAKDLKSRLNDLSEKNSNELLVIIQQKMLDEITKDPTRTTFKLDMSDFSNEYRTKEVVENTIRKLRGLGFNVEILGSRAGLSRTIVVSI